MRRKKTLLSWSSGKDSAWTLYQLQQDPAFELVGLFSTINKESERVAMHGVRVELLQQQAESIGLPLQIIDLPWPCSNADYEAIMGRFIDEAKEAGVECIAFGDLFLDDIRNYRIEKLTGTDIEPIFPVWGIPTQQLAQEMIAAGLRTIITCIDSEQTPRECVGQEFTQEFLRALPETGDPCGENGEFHSFVFDGPMFKKPIEIQVGEIVQRDQFIFADVLPVHAN